MTTRDETIRFCRTHWSPVVEESSTFKGGLRVRCLRKENENAHGQCIPGEAMVTLLPTDPSLRRWDGGERKWTR